MRFVIPLPTVVGLLTPHVGTTFAVHELATALIGSRIIVNLSNASTGIITLRVGDGIDDETVEVPAGNNSYSLAIDRTWAEGGTLELEVVSDAGADGGNLSGSVYVEDQGPSDTPGPNLITLGEAKLALRTGTTTAYEDIFLDEWIETASAVVREYTGQYLSLADWVDEWLYPTVVHVKAVPVNSVASAVADGQTYSGAQLRVHAKTGRLVRKIGGQWGDWVGVRELTVTYNAGFSQTPIQIRQCITHGLQPRFEDYRAGGTGQVAGETVRKVVYPEGGSVEFANAGALHSTQVSDFLAGFPLATVRPFRRPRGLDSPAVHLMAVRQ